MQKRKEGERERREKREKESGEKSKRPSLDVNEKREVKGDGENGSRSEGEERECVRERGKREEKRRM